MDNNNKAIEELETLLRTADPEMLSAISRFIETASIVHQYTRTATDINDVEDMCVCGLIDPVIYSAQLAPDPVKPLGKLFDLDKEVIMTDFIGRIIESAMPDSEKEQVINNIDHYEDIMISKLYSHINKRAVTFAESEKEIDNIISSWLYDLLKFKQENNKNKLDDVKRGFLSTWRSMKAYVKRQNSIVEGMLSNAKTPKDVSIWYSRYALVPAIENARDGYVKELALMTTLTDEQVIEDCVHLANELGIEASKEDFNIAQVRRSMRQLCKARTGYANHSVFLLSLLSDADAARLLPLFPDSEITRIKVPHRA